MADAHPHQGCPLVANLEGSLRSLIGLVPLVLPSDEVLVAAADNGVQPIVLPVVLALWADLVEDGDPTPTALRFWLFDRESASPTSHLALRRAEIVAQIVPCLAHLSEAARALAPALWAHAQHVSVLYEGSARPPTFRLTFANNQVVQSGDVDVFVRRVLRVFEAARGVPTGPHRYRVYPDMGSDDHRTLQANTVEDAALLSMVLERAHRTGTAPVRPPHKVVQTTETLDHPDLLVAAARLNALPFS